MNKNQLPIIPKGLTANYEVITPALAQRWIEENEDNFRKINKNNYEKILSDVHDGLFLPTNQGIGFDKNGRLIDGQHRLRAIVDANRAAVLLVCRGLDPAAMHLVDSGRVRDYHTKLTMAGRNEGRNVHSAIRLLSNLIEGRPAFYSPNHIEGLCELLESEQSSIEEIQKIVKDAADHKAAQALKAHSAHFLFAGLLGFHINESKTRFFLSKYVSGVGILSQKEPVQRARVFVLGVAGCRDPRVPQVNGVFMHCLALHLQGKDEVGVIKYSNTPKGVRWLYDHSGLAAKDKPLSKTFLPGSAHIGGGGQ